MLYQLVWLWWPGNMPPPPGSPQGFQSNAWHIGWLSAWQVNPPLPVYTFVYPIGQPGYSGIFSVVMPQTLMSAPLVSPPMPQRVTRSMGEW